MRHLNFLPGLLAVALAGASVYRVRVRSMRETDPLK
jgi:hypothetical protein